MMYNANKSVIILS